MYRLLEIKSNVLKLERTQTPCDRNYLKKILINNTNMHRINLILILVSAMELHKIIIHPSIHLLVCLSVYRSIDHSVSRIESSLQFDTTVVVCVFLIILQHGSCCFCEVLTVHMVSWWDHLWFVLFGKFFWSQRWEDRCEQYICLPSVSVFSESGVFSLTHTLINSLLSLACNSITPNTHLCFYASFVSLGSLENEVVLTCTCTYSLE